MVNNVLIDEQTIGKMKSKKYYHVYILGLVLVISLVLTTVGIIYHNKLKFAKTSSLKNTLISTEDTNLNSLLPSPQETTEETSTVPNTTATPENTKNQETTKTEGNASINQAQKPAEIVHNEPVLVWGAQASGEVVSTAHDPVSGCVAAASGSTGSIVNTSTNPCSASATNSQ